MAPPTKPTVPDAPLRSQPATFSARLEDSLLFWDTFATYLDDTSTYTLAQAEAALAAATAGDLPPITGQALNYIRVNAGETAVEFLTPAQVLVAIGAATAAQGTKADNAAPKISPAFTGVPTVPTATVGTDTEQAASTAFVMAETALKEPLSQSGAGVGQFTGISGATSASLSLPAGGQWSYNINRWSSGTQQSFATGIAAGGTLIGAAAGGQYWNGWAKRIS